MLRCSMDMMVCLHKHVLCYSSNNNVGIYNNGINPMQGQVQPSLASPTRTGVKAGDVTSEIVHSVKAY